MTRDKTFYVRTVESSVDSGRHALVEETPSRVAVVHVTTDKGSLFEDYHEADSVDDIETMEYISVDESLDLLREVSVSDVAVVDMPGDEHGQ